MSAPLVRMPSLDLLRGFVAVGRRMSITLAAQDLCLTQSAISRQILTLEEALGIKLLTRGYRAIAFTPEGERLFRTADIAMQQLQEAVATLRPLSRQPVNLTCSVGVAGLWLLPRLGRLQQRHPHIDLRVSANNDVRDLRADGLDLAIRYCAPDTAPRDALRLFDETIAPVAHPSLGLDKVHACTDLTAHCLLEYDGVYRPWLQWREWLAAQGWPTSVPRTLRFNQYDQVIHAAVAGQGVALGRLELLGPMLADGRLKVVATTGKGVPTTHAYWLIGADASSRADVAAVVEWIKDEAAAIAL